MLKVIQNAGRMAMDLGGIWNFQIQGQEAERPDYVPYPLKGAEPIAVPASYNDQKDEMEYRDHYGLSLYQREVEIPKMWEGQRILLRFEGAAHDAKVWVNETLAASHKGGFLPFEADLTELVKPGERILLTVSVDNRIGHTTLPMGNDPSEPAFFGSDNAGIPSVEEAKRRAKPQNRPNFDFFNYAGIYRPVFLYTTPKSYIEDITIQGDMEGNVSWAVQAEGEETLCLTILDAQGRQAAQAAGLEGKLTLSQPNLWEPWPGTPYLYTARFQWGEDCYELPFGLRSIQVEKTRFLINGKPFYFKGFGKHEDSFFRGRGLDNCLNVKDVNLIHWLGANSFRTSHYPYAQEMYELCDREGIVIIDETPAVGINMGERQNPYEFGTMEHHRQVIRDLINRDKNHPCVVMWSLGNEPDLEHFPQAAYDYWHSLYELAHSLDPQNRPVTLVCCQNDYTKDITSRTMDVVCLNRYYGWYNVSGDLDAACLGWNMELDFWEKQGKPVMLTEYGADCVAGLHQTVPGMFSEEYQAQYYERINGECDKRPFFIGEQVWNFADFATIQGPMRVGGNRKGLFTRERTPKLAAHFLRRRWNQIPNFGYKEDAYGTSSK